MSYTTDKKIKQAYQEWTDALEDAIFMHDKEFRILRCNRAYQQLAGLPFNQIIGQPYFEIFPKTHVPFQNCLHAMEKTVAEEVHVGDTIFRTHAYVIKDEQGGYIYSLHTLEDITEHKRREFDLAEQVAELRRWYDNTMGREGRILDLKHEVNVLLAQVGKPPRYPSAESPD